MRHVRACCLVLLATLLVASEWTPVSWREEPAWSAQRDGWVATVSATWGRLVSLRAPDGTETIRVDPAPRLAECAGRTGGGHMVWLGPQARWGWPPPAHWEYASPATDLREGELRFALPAGDGKRPALTRTYRWTPEGLRMAVRWRAAGDWHALHIVQVVRDAVVRLQPRPSALFPRGFAVQSQKDQPHRRADFTLPQPCAVADGEAIRLVAGDPFQKLFFPPQPVVARIRDWRVELRAGEERGAVTGPSDDGLTTQAFLGREFDFVEIEQCSPMLDAGDGEAESAVVLAFGAP